MGIAAAVPVDGFTYGALTPVAGFAAAAVGGALGLRCTVRALAVDPARRVSWLLLGALAFGSGIFAMHFIAMLGFTVPAMPISYDLGMTYASLLVAVVVTGIGVFLVGSSARSTPVLLGAGLVTGLGVAAMHYMGMASMQMAGSLAYRPAVVALSVVIAVVAATAALWFALTTRGFAPAIGASLVMGVAVSGMHYTGMYGVEVHQHATAAAGSGSSALDTLLVVLIVPMFILLFVAMFVGLDPMTTRDMHRAIDHRAQAPRPARAAGPARGR